jgi:uncharacterized membrane protein YidH (DUF202 family)
VSGPAGTRPPRDPGVAHERTALAWQRMALGFLSLAALVIGLAARDQSAWMLVPAAVIATASGVVWMYGRVRAGSTAGPADRHRLALARLSAATLGLAALAVVIVLSRVV